MSNRDAKSPGCFFIAEKEKKEMELTIREKAVLNVFGCMNYEATMKRLGLACVLMVDPLTKASACSLRNKLAEVSCDIWYRHLYCRIREECNSIERIAA